MIEIRGLRKKLNDKWVLDGLDLDIHEGMSLVIMGPSGTGKSVLLKHMIGLIRQDSGDIFFNGKPLVALRKKEREALKMKFSYMFQGTALFDSMNVYDNVALPLREHTKLEESTIDIMTRIKLELVGLGGVDRRDALYD